MITDWPLKFANKSEADSKLYIDGVPIVSFIDIIGQREDGWYVNIGVRDNFPSILLPYVIPFPLKPERIRFTAYEGAAL